jgi:arabinose-5-phosphate isomerase
VVNAFFLFSFAKTIRDDYVSGMHSTRFSFDMKAYGLEQTTNKFSEDRAVSDPNFQAYRRSALQTLVTEIEALAIVKEALNGELGDRLGQMAVTIETQCHRKGRVIVTGMGKSGHVGTKVAATLASTGTPAYFVHPAEASHGDLGMITKDDCVLALSWSGETGELRNLIEYTKRFSIPLLAITSGAQSTLAKAADYAMILPKVPEACPHGLAPTSSTLLQLACGDALAIALLEARGFSAHDFKTFHPGGQLGANLAYVHDVMHEGEALPIVAPGTSMQEAIVTMSEKSLGCVLIADETRQLLGIITDGDLRRHIKKDFASLRVDDVMSSNPCTIRSSELLVSALAMMNEKRITNPGGG